MSIETQNVPGVEVTSSRRFVSMELRLQLAKEIAKQIGMPDDIGMTTEEAVRQVREATRHLHEQDPNGASREIIAMRNE